MGRQGGTGLPEDRPTTKHAKGAKGTQRNPGRASPTTEHAELTEGTGRMVRVAAYSRVFCVFRSQLPLAGPRGSTNYETRERRERNPEKSWTRFPNYGTRGAHRGNPEGW